MSKQTIFTITDKVIEGMVEWQNPPLDRIYPMVFLDAINVKICDGKLANRPIYVALAVTVDGTRDILGRGPATVRAPSFGSPSARSRRTAASRTG